MRRRSGRSSSRERRYTPSDSWPAPESASSAGASPAEFAREEAMVRDLDREARNKALVLEAFDVLFNRRDFAAAEQYYSPTYLQHSAVIAPGRDGLFSLVRGLTRRYESALAVAEGDYVMVHDGSITLPFGRLAYKQLRLI